MSQIKLSAVALAAMGLFAGAAQAQSTVIASSGASATRNTVLTLFTTSICGATAVQHFQAPSAEGGSNVRAARCGNAPGKVFSIDTDGGSWRAAAVKNATVFNAAITGADPAVKKVRYLDLSACPTAATTGTLAAPVTCTPATGVLAAKVIGTAPTNATLLTAPTDVDIGFADTDQLFFDGTPGVDLGTSNNLPGSLGLTTWTKFSGATGNGGTVTPIPALGIVFGIAASRQLIQDMMADQGITVASNPTCFNADGTANLAPAAAEACAPVITRDQYRSLTTFTFNQLNTTGDNLFRNAGTSPGQLAIERRDFGSGTQAVANAYFQGVGCSPYYLAPAGNADDPSYTENNATGDVLTRLSLPGVRSLGIVSRENTPAATPAAGSTNQNWGFLKLATGAEKGAIVGLNGGYPKSANATRGLYDFWSVGYAFKKSNETNADVNTITAGITAGTNITATEGVFQLKAITTGTRGTGTAFPTNGSYYDKKGMSLACTGGLAF